MALDASAEERETRGFISMTTSRPVLGAIAKLHVRAAGLHADLAQHRQTRVAHDLVFLIGQRLGRGYRDGIAGVHPHGVKVFDRADIMMQLSSVSRTTSISYSFQPISDIRRSAARSVGRASPNPAQADRCRTRFYCRRSRRRYRPW